MRAGELRQRVTIQKNTPAANSFGEYVDTWTTYAVVWAAIEPVSGRRYFEALQANADVSGVCRIRYRDGIEPTMRLYWDGRYFTILSIVQPREAKKEIHIYYKEALD